MSVLSKTANKEVEGPDGKNAGNVGVTVNWNKMGTMKMRNCTTAKCIAISSLWVTSRRS